ncbi:hypothetical protein HDU86_000778 [Geranomyces michiganensis]|nr:hypothetical protein HDU86_000778 [Geranomyces michiganensis]
MTELLYKHPPTLRFMNIRLYNSQHPDLPDKKEDVFAFHPWDCEGELDTLVFNTAWFPTLPDPKGTRTDHQRLAMIALGLVTFLHELAHFCVAQANLTSPLTNEAPNASKQIPETLLGCVEEQIFAGRSASQNSRSDEFKQDRESREAGFRLEEQIFGGRPALDAPDHPLCPDGLVLDVRSSPEQSIAVSFTDWPLLVSGPDAFFAAFPLRASSFAANLPIPNAAARCVRKLCTCEESTDGAIRSPLPLVLPAIRAGGSEGRRRSVLPPLS